MDAPAAKPSSVRNKHEDKTDDENNKVYLPGHTVSLTNKKGKYHMEFIFTVAEDRKWCTEWIYNKWTLKRGYQAVKINQHKRKL